jgi:hypothetical protein
MPKRRRLPSHPAHEDRQHAAMQAFLVMDIQRSPEWAQELARKISEVKAGALARWERTGNAYHLVLTPGGARIEDTVDDSAAPVAVTLDELELAVRRWIAGLD